MKSILELINELPEFKWDYYFGIDSSRTIGNPFALKNYHGTFIRNYFKRGGKTDVFKTSGIKISQIRYPNHINSVFFLGILLYNKTSFNKLYKLEKNEPGYRTFPFIWFLIALFHDNAYDIELSNLFKDIASLDELLRHYKIDNFLFDVRGASKCNSLMDSRKDYFNFRLKEMHKVDHGLLGGILLYDRLLKIRREAKKYHEDDLYWGEELEGQYQIAAEAISIHNIWLPNSKATEDLYENYNLNNLINFRKVRFKDFPLFYILGIIDTIEPIKTYQSDEDDQYILDNILLKFKQKSLTFYHRPGSRLDFSKLKQKTKYFEGWLDVDVKMNTDHFELIFK